MRRNQRHKYARGIKTISELTYSDHKPAVLNIETKMMKKWRQRERNAPILRRQGLHGNFFHCIMDLHESTNYCVKSQHGASSSWTPKRCLREGCPTSPVLFNLFHQIVTEKAEETSVGKPKRKNMGIEWNCLAGGKLPSKSLYGRYNAEAKKPNITMSLFADDTTILDTKEDLEKRYKAIKEVMFFQKNK